MKKKLKADVSKEILNLQEVDLVKLEKNVD
jgi:hypothetical protein